MIYLSKGAPEKILDMCASVLIGEKEHVLDYFMKDEIKATFLKLASLGERVLGQVFIMLKIGCNFWCCILAGFCDYQLPTEQYPENYLFDENNFEINEKLLRFVGLVSLIDPPRSGKQSCNKFLVIYILIFVISCT